MKKNRFQEVLSRGQIPIGHMIVDFNVRGLAKMLEVAGLDFVVIDMEHGGFGHAGVADLVAWFKATSVAPFVRVPVGTYPFIARVLDTGALGVMVPNVKTGSEARTIVEAVKYRPLGGRGLTFGSAVNDYEGVPDVSEYMREANERTTVICQIESHEALDHLDDIASTRGIDVLWVGQFDLTNSMGIPGDFKNSRFHSALKQVIAAAHKHGKHAAIQGGSVAQLKGWAELGFDALSYSEDIGVYIAAVSDGVKDLRAAVARPAAEGTRHE
ncbi:MAG: aldolase/citrate lyase family protein [Acidobacteria bacterium]|nr:aldolase/citrate lyase family protein [Acidobacteriota bacterium]